jgi:DNA-binding GntR family transcriptional regulator
MKQTKLKKEYGSNAKNAFIAIRDLIVHGRLAPGSWIVESDICAKLGMSRTPIRAALQWLQYEGYVVAQGTGTKSRMIVAPLTQGDAQELYGIVGHIEGIGGRLAAGLPDRPRASLVSSLKKLNDQLMKAARPSQPETGKFADLDTKFHDEIVKAGAGPRLLAIYDAIKPQTERYWRLYSSSNTPELQTSCQEHAEIIGAISIGDPEKTEAALRNNWELGSTRLVKAIQTFGERGDWFAPPQRQRSSR